ncbi:imidazole glycerol phosphate synthase subunit HisH [Caproicibacterium amylolyticum]|uniref:Imidazole glycerol phosphate synthase subunit HisH n=1 Tax=Caproicibacterium amylolyticum TaxID=2766537 RepID=A0A7G9WKF9_9FIRM|nr:imidazole glycerol phosphate synthase subunit HisH [Caproicibacterium amylolyticum]QNO19171.1 imidazole glycerol phosphate synthase subunit HisH [Caproicibacterium amylolyticum]
MIAVIDYGAGNLQSVLKAFQYIGSSVQVTADPEVLRAADAVVLPGVGAFGDAMENLKKSGLVNTVYDLADSNKPFLGICLGLQLLFEGSEEAPGVPGLGIFRGEIRRIPAGEGLKIPHIGWNSLEIRDKTGVFQNLPENPYVYFVHSYYLKADYKKEVAATTQYGVEIDAAVRRKNLYAMQFHPEKSGKVGLQILRNFTALTKED